MPEIKEQKTLLNATLGTDLKVNIDSVKHMNALSNQIKNKPEIYIHYNAFFQPWHC
jgi:hypothetical protein